MSLLLYVAYITVHYLDYKVGAYIYIYGMGATTQQI